MRKKIGMFAVIIFPLSALAVPAAFGAETVPDIRFYTDAQRTQEAQSVSVLLGGGRVDLYYTVKGSQENDTSLEAVAADETVVNVFTLSGRVCFVAEAGKHRAGTTQVTVTADGCAPRTLQVTTAYAEAESLALKIDGSKPGYYVDIDDALTVEFGIPFPVYAEALDASGNKETLNPALDYVWSFAENGCGASFLEGAVRVTGTGTADATVALELDGTPVGISRTFRITSVFQQMASDVDILADRLSITGIRYTLGSDTVSLVYREGNENLSREIALDALTLGYGISNQAYTDPADAVWSSTDSDSVSVSDGKLTFGETISGTKQVTITLTNRDKTVMDSVLVVVSVEKPEKSGCGTAGSGTSYLGMLLGLLLCAGVLCKNLHNDSDKHLEV